MSDQPRPPADRASNAIIYVLCGLTAFAGVLHLYFLRNWPGWRYSLLPNPLPYVVQFIPVFALVTCGIAVVMTRRGNGRRTIWALSLAAVLTLCVLALDGCTGTIGMVD